MTDEMEEIVRFSRWRISCMDVNPVDMPRRASDSEYPKFLAAERRRDDDGKARRTESGGRFGEKSEFRRIPRRMPGRSKGPDGNAVQYL